MELVNWKTKNAVWWDDCEAFQAGSKIQKLQGEDSGLCYLFDEVILENKKILQKLKHFKKEEIVLH